VQPPKGEYLSSFKTLPNTLISVHSCPLVVSSLHGYGLGRD
jgi:hypothetical protein